MENSDLSRHKYNIRLFAAKRGNLVEFEKLYFESKFRISIEIHQIYKMENKINEIKFESKLILEERKKKAFLCNVF